MLHIPVTCLLDLEPRLNGLESTRFKRTIYSMPKIKDAQSKVDTWKKKQLKPKPPPIITDDHCHDKEEHIKEPEDYNADEAHNEKMQLLLDQFLLDTAEQLDGELCSPRSPGRRFKKRDHSPIRSIQTPDTGPGHRKGSVRSVPVTSRETPGLGEDGKGRRLVKNDIKDVNKDPPTGQKEEKPRRVAELEREPLLPIIDPEVWSILNSKQRETLPTMCDSPIAHSPRPPGSPKKTLRSHFHSQSSFSIHSPRSARSAYDDYHRSTCSSPDMSPRLTQYYRDERKRGREEQQKEAEIVRLKKEVVEKKKNEEIRLKDSRRMKERETYTEAQRQIDEENKKRIADAVDQRLLEKGQRELSGRADKKRQGPKISQSSGVAATLSIPKEKGKVKGINQTFKKVSNTIKNGMNVIHKISLLSPPDEDDDADDKSAQGSDTEKPQRQRPSRRTSLAIPQSGKKLKPFLNRSQTSGSSGRETTSGINSQQGSPKMNLRLSVINDEIAEENHAVSASSIRKKSTKKKIKMQQIVNWGEDTRDDELSQYHSPLPSDTEAPAAPARPSARLSVRRKSSFCTLATAAERKHSLQIPTSLIKRVPGGLSKATVRKNIIIAIASKFKETYVCPSGKLSEAPQAPVQKKQEDSDDDLFFTGSLELSFMKKKNNKKIKVKDSVVKKDKLTISKDLKRKDNSFSDQDSLASGSRSPKSPRSSGPPDKAKPKQRSKAKELMNTAIKKVKDGREKAGDGETSSELRLTSKYDKTSSPRTRMKKKELTGTSPDHKIQRMNTRIGRNRQAEITEIANIAKEKGGRPPKIQMTIVQAAYHEVRQQQNMIENFETITFCGGREKDQYQ